MESCAIINWEERENNGRRRECFQTSDDLPWKTLLWWKVNAAVRPRFPCGDHGERPRWGERCWAGKKRDDDYKRTHDFLLDIDANRKSPLATAKHFLPFTFYQLSSFAGISPIVSLNFGKIRITFLIARKEETKKSFSR